MVQIREHCSVETERPLARNFARLARKFDRSAKLELEIARKKFARKKLELEIARKNFARTRSARNMSCSVCSVFARKLEKSKGYDWMSLYFVLRIHSFNNLENHFEILYIFRNIDSILEFVCHNFSKINLFSCDYRYKKRYLSKS